MGPTISLTHIHFQHTSGSKDYDLFLIDTGEKSQSYVLKRWGKTQTKGTFKLDVYKNINLGKGMFKAERKKRKERQYGDGDMTMYGMFSIEELEKTIKECIPYSKAEAKSFTELRAELESEEKLGKVVFGDPNIVKTRRVSESAFHADWGAWG
ncbi:hypothetical protein VCR15J2_390110 [Vibrio coralliirubri]|uniref:hypothetical protein n=1 Tax=Vibrio coralliirubri TaxID=1516159 RepID=UPI000633CE2A|nr:hypothetical protein [Vibrio coralliirubri]CDT53885.1 hypothetical protein VCR15J2_390110 [Vibrio coralliirubri]